MTAVRCLNHWVSEFKWLRIVLVFTLLIAMVLQTVSATTNVRAAAGAWIQSTFDDFNRGTLDKVQVVIIDPGDPTDNGNVILDSVPLDQENWEPARPPNTPKIYGDNLQAQTFRATKDGRYVTITTYISKIGNPTDLQVELWSCTTDDPITAEPKAPIYSGYIPSPQVTEAGAYDVSMTLPDSAPIESDTMYAIALYQNGGSISDYYVTSVTKTSSV